jgi:PII-like signaling protein
VSVDGLRLTVYFGERDRVDGHLTSDLLLDVFERRGVRAASLYRATEGFGIKHRLHTQRTLTLSEDLPLVAVAVDEPEAVEGLLSEVEPLLGEGLVTLERLRIATDEVPETGDDVRLTLHLGRGERVAGRAAHLEAVDALRRHGVDGATVLLGVDGLLHGVRTRARLLSSNGHVPLTITSVGAPEAIGAALVDLAQRLGNPFATLERAQVCKRDGEVRRLPPAAAPADAFGLGMWQKLTVVVGEQARHGRHPVYVELVHRLRLAGAAGATALRGVWGYSGDHAPHGDRVLAVRRRVPVVVTLVDRPERMQEWWEIVDDVTAGHGLVTSELVPAFRAVGPGIAEGGLRLAAPHA